MTHPAEDVAVPARAGTARWIVLPVAVVLGLLVVLLATRDPGGEQVDRSIEGRLAPSVVGVSTDGEVFDLDGERGRWVVVNFFSTTCQPCIVEHPELVAFQEEHLGSGEATVVSIAFDDSADNVREFFAANGGDWPVLVEDTGSLAVAYGVTGVPESYLVAPSGIVALKLVGGVEQADLESAIGQFEAAGEDGS